jgi:hypothetical protein
VRWIGDGAVEVLGRPVRQHLFGVTFPDARGSKTLAAVRDRSDPPRHGAPKDGRLGTDLCPVLILGLGRRTVPSDFGPGASEIVFGGVAVRGGRAVVACGEGAAGGEEDAADVVARTASPR